MGPKLQHGVFAPDDAAARHAGADAQTFEFSVRDVVYMDTGDARRLARVYQPAGTGPFPVVILIHGGAWNNKDRKESPQIAIQLNDAGIAVVALDFRNAPEAPYPASLQDINYGIRWVKANANRFGSTPDRVGLLGTSSGGHQAMLAAIRPQDERYGALALNEAPDVDAKVAFVISGWGVLFPHERYLLAKSQGKKEMVENHHRFFGTDEAVMLEASPPHIIERKESVHLAPALVFMGTADEWMTVEQGEHLAKLYRDAGGTLELDLYEGERHTFVNEFPLRQNSINAMENVVAFVKKHAG